MTIRGAGAIVALAVVLLAPAGAHAGGVRLSYGCDRECEPTLEFTALPGEENEVTMSEGPERESAIVSDTGAPLTPGYGCSAVDEHTVSCVPEYYEYLDGATARLGDGDDRVDAIDYILSADGGSGDDTLLGPGTLKGGGGHDLIDGRGYGTAVFTGRHVRVDLESSKPQGGRGSKDVLRDITNVDALEAKGAVVRGDDGANTLDVSKDGVVEGRGGRDRLYAGPGGRADGGDGNDLIRGNDFDTGPLRSPTTLDCGEGHDEVYDEALNDSVSACEAVYPTSIDGFFRDLVETPGAGEPFVVFKFVCGITPRCPLLLEARVGSLEGRLVAHHRLRQRRNGELPSDRRHGLKLNADGRELLQRRGRLRVVVSAREWYGDPPVYGEPVGFTTVLRG